MDTTMLNNPFWEAVDVKGPDDCWEWKGLKAPNGYGIFGAWSSLGTTAHRVAWELKNGPIPKFIDGKKTVIRHMCDNRSCVNPSHLKIGNYGDNMRDARRLGRGMKYSKDDFKKVKDLRQEGKTHREIRDILNMTIGPIKNMLSGRGIYKEWAMELEGVKDD